MLSFSVAHRKALDLLPHNLRGDYPENQQVIGAEFAGLSLIFVDDGALQNYVIELDHNSY